MGENTTISWATHTFNPWRGCTKVSPGCANCYAEAGSKRNHAVLGVWGPQGTRVVASESMWREPVKWNAAAAKAGERHRVFCASLADVFEDWQGPIVDSDGNTMLAHPLISGVNAAWPLTLDHVRTRLFRLIDKTPNLDWLLLTKRPENVRRMVDCWVGTNPLPRNVWLGTSVENQECAHDRIPHLLQTPAAVRFLSVEPLLGEVTIAASCPPDWDAFNDATCSEEGWQEPEEFVPECEDECDWINCGNDLVHSQEHQQWLRDKQSYAKELAFRQGIQWVIAGGESGRDARTCQIEWIRSIVQQCKAAEVPVFVKQLGARITTTLPDGEAWPGHDGPRSRVQFSGDGFGNYHVSGLRDSKGGEPSEWPADLRVREFPKANQQQ